MTYLPKSELVGVLSPSSINTKDIGKNWRLTASPVGIGIATASTYIGNGISLIGVQGGEIWRSTDYAVNWFDLGDITGTASGINFIRYIGNGIVIAGENGGNIYRSTDFGITWAGVAGNPISAGYVFSSAYIGNGIVIVGDTEGHIFISTDFGVTWVDEGDVIGGDVVCVTVYLENGITIIGDYHGNVWRSTNFGSAPWVIIPNLGIFFVGAGYLGNGIVVLTDFSGRVVRSNDYGLTWTNLGYISDWLILVNVIYAGNGIAVFGNDNGHIFGSTNYGLTWTDIGVAGPFVNSMFGLDNGILAVHSGIDIYRSDISYKIDENQVNYPRIPTDVTASRALSPSEYTNLDQTRSLLVCVSCNCQGGGGAGGVATFQLLADTASPPVTDASPLVGINSGLINKNNIFQTTGVVRPGYNYRILPNIAGTGTVTLVDWFEMYI